MKKIYSVVMLLATMVTALSFTSCSKDDDNNGSNGGSGGSVIGTWMCDAQEQLGIEVEGISSAHYIQFKADGSMISINVSSYDKSVWGDYTPKDEVLVERGTWKTADGKLYTDGDDGKDVAEYSVSGNKLTVTSTSGIIAKITYTRVADNTSDKYLNGKVEESTATTDSDITDGTITVLFDGKNSTTYYAVSGASLDGKYFTVSLSKEDPKTWEKAFSGIYLPNNLYACVSWQFRSLDEIKSGTVIEIGGIFWNDEVVSTEQEGGKVYVKSIKDGKVTLNFQNLKFEHCMVWGVGSSEYEMLTVNGDITFTKE